MPVSNRILSDNNLNIISYLSSFANAPVPHVWSGGHVIQKVSISECQSCTERHQKHSKRSKLDSWESQLISLTLNFQPLLHVIKNDAVSRHDLTAKWHGFYQMSLILGNMEAPSTNRIRTNVHVDF